MALLTKKEFFDWLNVILKDGFKIDDEKMTVSVKKQLTEKEMDSIVCSFYNLMGSKSLPHPKTHEDFKALCQEFKMNANFVPVDGKTIKVNKYGQIYADIDRLTNNGEIVKALLNNHKFMKEVKRHLLPEKMTMDFVEMWLLRSPRFLDVLTRIITKMQELNDGKIEKKTAQDIIDEELEDIEVPNEDESILDESDEDDDVNIDEDETEESEEGERE